MTSALPHQLASWNRQHPVGSVIWYYKTIPHGPVHELTVDKPAFIHPETKLPMVFLKGLLVTVPMWNCFPVNEAKRNEVNPVPLDDSPTGKVTEAHRLAEHGLDAIKHWYNVMLPGRGDRHFLKKAGLHFLAAAEACEQAYKELGE